MDVLKVVESYCDSPEAYYVNDKLEGEVHCNDMHEIKPLLINLMRRYNVTETQFFNLTDEGEEFIVHNGYEYPDSFEEIAGYVEYDD